MKLLNDENGIIVEELYSGINLRTNEKRTIGICQRDFGYEMETDRGGRISIQPTETGWIVTILNDEKLLTINDGWTEINRGHFKNVCFIDSPTLTIDNKFCYVITSNFYIDGNFKDWDFTKISKFKEKMTYIIDKIKNHDEYKSCTHLYSITYKPISDTQIKINIRGLFKN